MVRPTIQSEQGDGAERIVDVLDQTDLLVVRVDLEGRFTHVNAAYCRMFGKTREELIGNTFMPLVHEDDREPTRRAMEHLLSPPYTCAVEQRAMTVRGWRWITWHDRAILDKQGRMSGVVAVGLDITDTENRQHQDQIRQREHNFRSFFDLVPDLLFIANEEGRVLDANRAAHERLGFKPGGLRGVDVPDLHLPEHRAEVVTVLTEMLAGQRDLCTYPIRGLNGVTLPVETRATQGRWNGAPALFAVSRDLTAQQEARSAAEHLAEMGRLLVKLSADLMNSTPADVDTAIQLALATVGTFCRVDRSYLFLFDPQERYTDNTHEWCAEGITPEIANLQQVPVTAMPAWMKALRRSENIYFENVAAMGDEWAFERELLLAQGIQSVLVVPLTCQNRLMGFAGFDNVRSQRMYSNEEIALLRFLADMLAGLLHRRKMNDDLLWQTTLLSGLLDSIPDIVFFKDPNGVYLGANREFKRLTGHEQDGVIGKTDRDLFDSSTAGFFREQDRLMMEHGEPRHNEEWVTYPDGHRVLIDTLKAPLKAPDGRLLGLLGVSRDITLRHQLETHLKESHDKLADAVAELKLARDEAERATRIKSDFVASMSHEIRTPLNAILGYAQILQRTPDAPAAFQDGLSVIRQSGEHLLSMLNEVLSLARMDAEHPQLDTASINFRTLLLDLLRMFELRAQEHALRLELRYSPATPEILIGDEMRVRQIMLNLLSNAIRFTKQGAVTVQVDAVDRPGAPRKWNVQVQDTGCGMRPEEMATIFEPFVQGAGGRKSGEGTGLGLSISRRLAQAMGGDLSVESKEGIGSTFLLTITDQPMESEARPRAAGRPKVRCLDMNAQRRELLVVDDNEHNRRMLGTMLGLVGFHVRHAHSGEDALAQLTHWHPDCILLDKRMPGMDGLATLQRIKEDPAIRDIPVLLVTASSTRLSPADSRMKDAAGVLLKPLREDELFQELARVLGVSYEYATPDPEEDPGTPPMLPAEVIATMTADERTAMRKAIHRGDARTLRAMAETLVARRPQAAQPLRALIDRYEYTRLLELLDAPEAGASS